MIKKISTLVFLAFFFLASCQFNGKDPQIDNYTATDTVSIFDTERYFSCSEPLYKKVAINIFKPFKIISEAGKNGGLVYVKNYLRKDSVEIEVLHENIPFYDEEIMRRNGIGFSKGMILKDTLLTTPNYRLLTIYGSIGDRVVSYFVFFNDFGYFHLKITDERNLPNKLKVEESKRILDNLKSIDASIDFKENFSKFKNVYSENNCKRCNEIKHKVVFENSNPLNTKIHVIINQNDIKSTTDLDNLAECILKNCDANSQSGSIHLFNEKGNSEYIKIAEFKINRCLQKYNDDINLCNKASCVWLNTDFKKMLFNPHECEKLWSMIGEKEKS